MSSVNKSKKSFSLQSTWHVYSYRSSVTKSVVLKIVTYYFTRLSKMIAFLLACLHSRVLN